MYCNPTPEESTILPFIHFFDDQLWNIAKDLEISVIATQKALNEIGVSIQPITKTLFEKYFKYLNNKGELQIKNIYATGSI